MSTYVIERPHTPYGDQPYFEQQREIAVSTAVNSFHEAVEKKDGLTALFHETLSHFEKTRLAIAQQSQTQNHESFGIRRDGNHTDSPFLLTPMYPPYDEYGERLLSVLQGHLSKIPHSLKTFPATTLSFKEEPYQGTAFNTEIEVLTMENASKWVLDHSWEEYQHYCSLCEITCNPLEILNNPLSRWEQLVRNLKAMEKLKQNNLEAYKKFRTVLAILKIRELSPKPKKSDWVVVTLRLQMGETLGKQMYAISQYITWMYRDFTEDPVDHMKDYSIVYIMHQDPFLIQPMLDHIANIFKQAIECDSQNVTQLKFLMACFEYKFSHTTPHLRGSAAIGEWFMLAIARYHRFNLVYNQKKMPNLEALTSPFGTFMKNYDSMIQLEPISHS